MDGSALWRRLFAEWLGSALLAAVVIGSGIAAQRLSPGAVGLELLYNAAATAAGLFALILMFGPVSGAHFNPVVSLVDSAFGGLRWRDALAYLPAQIAGCVCGAALANVMFSKAAITISAHHRGTGAHFVSEIVATAGLLLVIFALARTGRTATAPAAVGAYIGAAYWFTSSTSFANPAITVGRMFSNSFAGIAPASAPAFIAAQVVGGVIGYGVIKILYPAITPAEASAVVIPHPTTASATRRSKTGPVSAADIEVRAMADGDWPWVSAIYAAGIATGNATFETSVPTWEVWDEGHLGALRFVAVIDGHVAGWAAASPVSDRCCYAGVVENSVYVHPDYQGRGVGRACLQALIDAATGAGVWTIQTGIFPENIGSVALHEACGFRVVGRRERLGQLGGVWRDVLLLEHRRPD